MEQTFDNIWISSIAHQEEFSLIAKSNGWFKTLFGMNKIPADFPQVTSGSKYYPVVYFAKGSLQLFEREIEFHPYRFEADNRKKYKNLKIDYRFDLEYSSIRISEYSNPAPFMNKFNIRWLKLSGKNNEFPEILISCGGTGMGQIKRDNEELLDLLEEKIH